MDEPPPGNRDGSELTGMCVCSPRTSEVKPRSAAACASSRNRIWSVARYRTPTPGRWGGVLILPSACVRSWAGPAGRAWHVREQAAVDVDGGGLHVPGVVGG